MELRQLLYTVAVAEAGNVTRAAANVSVAQPAVSAQIRRLERELGEPLFNREPRGVTLTAVGEAFLPHARAALAAIERGRAAIASLQGLLEGRLDVGVSGPMDRRFAAALGEFSRAHPGIELALREDNRDRIATAVGNGDLGVAQICMTGEPIPPAVRTAVVAVDPLVLAVAQGHPFASRRRVAFADLEDEPLVTLAAGTGLRMGLEQGCSEAGFVPRVVAETNEIRSLLDLTASDVGVALVPRSVGADDRLVLVDIRHPQIERPIGIAWNDATASPAVRAFLALAQENFENEGASVTPLHRTAETTAIPG